MGTKDNAGPTEGQVQDSQAEGTTKADVRIAQACEAYGIPEQFVHSARFDPASGITTVVTHGGKKIRFHPDSYEKIEPLSEIEVTGINPENAKRKPIAGRKR